MKRILAATALAGILATGVHAQTEGEIVTIQRYLPNVDVSTLSDDQVIRLLNIADGGASDGEKNERMEAVVMEGNMVEAGPLTEGQMVQLQNAAPGIDFSAYSDAELQQALAIVGSADSPGDVQAKLEAFANDRTMVSGGQISDGELAMIRSYRPDADLSSLTGDEILQLRTVIASGNRNDIRTMIDSVLAN